jgi:hypothetical protein
MAPSHQDYISNPLDCIMYVWWRHNFRGQAGLDDISQFGPILMESSTSSSQDEGHRALMGLGTRVFDAGVRLSGAAAEASLEGNPVS